MIYRIIKEEESKFPYIHAFIYLHIYKEIFMVCDYCGLWKN